MSTPALFTSLTHGDKRARLSGDVVVRTQPKVEDAVAAAPKLALKEPATT
jgi:hypothetical protein